MKAVVGEAALCHYVGVSRAACAHAQDGRNQRKSVLAEGKKEMRLSRPDACSSFFRPPGPPVSEMCTVSVGRCGHGITDRSWLSTVVFVVKSFCHCILPDMLPADPVGTDRTDRTACSPDGKAGDRVLPVLLERRWACIANLEGQP